jgi:hypothetical protein
MIKNKQVSIWRGPDTPPTLYHIWLKDENQLLRYDEDQGQWIVFLDSKEIANIIDDFFEKLGETLTMTINGHPVKESPVLTAEDFLIGFDGNYLKSENTVKGALQIMD